MRLAVHRIEWIGLLLLGGALSACWMRGGSEVHVIPEGFVGPVVIVFGVPGGESVDRGASGTLVFRIPRTGQLFVKGPHPKPGWYLRTYVVEAGNGTRLELPHDTPTSPDPGRLQILGRSDGAALRDVGEIAFLSYYVGVPRQRHPGWGDQVERLTDEAIQEAAAVIESAGRIHSP